MKHLLFIIFGVFTIVVNSQQSSIGLSGGYTTNGIAGIAEYNHHWGSHSTINSSLYYSYNTIKENELEALYSDITVNVGYYHKVHNAEQGRFKILLGGGGVIGYEIINNGKDVLDNGVGIKGESQIIYGAYVGTNLNYFISDAFALSLVGNEFYHINSDLGNFVFYVGVGLKYYVF